MWCLCNFVDLPVKRVLPSTPRKAVAIIKELINTMSPLSKSAIIRPRRLDNHGNTLSDELKELVRLFYQDDINTRVMPGKKDVLTVRNVDKSKVKMRKRLVLDDISNLHLKFNAEYPNHLIGKSKFFDLRPLWVIPIRDQSQEVCKCIYHENINLLCTLLRNFARSMKLDLDYKILANSDNIWEATVCDKYNCDCVWRKCDKCGCHVVTNLFSLHQYEATTINVNQWESTIIEKEKGSFRVVKKATKEVPISTALEMLTEQLQTFSVHNYTNIVQLHNFKFAKQHLKEGEIIISEDFSENYSINQQNEIMSAHWSQEELSLFCATAHFVRDGEKQFQHYVLCSNDLGHDKDSVYFYNKFIINDLKAKKLQVSKVHYWSDGPSSQFKNQFNFTNLKFHEKDYQCMADWSFFATSHGKGENDGLGGDVKNAVWRQTMQLKVVVNNLFDFVNVAQKTFPHFNIVAFLSAEVWKDSEFLQNRYSEHSEHYPGHRNSTSLASKMEKWLVTSHLLVAVVMELQQQ